MDYKPSKLEFEINIKGLYGPRVSVDIYIPPENIDETYDAVFENTTLQGRSSPIIGYGSGGPRQLNFPIVLHDDFIFDKNKDILDVVDDLKSFLYPEYKNRVISPKILVRVADMISFTGVCNNIGINWQRPYGNSSKGRKTYLMAEVSMSFQEVVAIPSSASEIAGSG